MFQRFVITKALVVDAFKNRLKKAIAVAKEISDQEKRRTVANEIKRNVKEFYEIYNNEHFTAQEIFDFSRYIVDGVDSTVIAARYGDDSPEMERLVAWQFEQREQELENRRLAEQERVWEEEQKRLKRPTKGGSKR